MAKKRYEAPKILASVRLSGPAVDIVLHRVVNHEHGCRWSDDVTRHWMKSLVRKSYGPDPSRRL